MNTVTSVARAGAAIALLCTALAAHAAETTRYVLLTGNGTPGGEQIVARSDDGRISVRYRYKDNGRGPDLDERIQMSPDGTVASYDVTGTSTMGGPVDEHFSLSAAKARWHSTSERGEATVDAPALYIPLNGSFELASIGITALAARPDGKLPLLPSGTLTQRVIDETEVVSGGQRRKVQLMAQTGLGLSPSFYWATVAARPRLFGAIYPGWMTLIEAGWEGEAPALAQRQRAAQTRLLKEMATLGRQPLTGLTVLRNARIFDSETARLGAASDIYMLRGHVTAIVPVGTLSVDVDAEIDAAGRIVLPGLFDMHAHLDRWEGALHLAAGVTTVRDLGNDNVELQQMIDATAAGELLSPRIVPCGFLEGDSPDAAHSGFVIKTLQQAKDAVDWYAAHGYPQLKIYNSFPREMVREVVAHAHARGMRVSGHVPAFMRAQEVVEQGYDEIQHINQVLLNFLVTPTTDTRTLARFYLPAEKLAALDFDAPPVRDFIALLQQHHTVIDPTLATFDFIQQRDGEMSQPYAAIASHLPADVQRNLRLSGMKIPDDATAARYRDSYAKMIEFVGRMERAGIPIVAGTDAFAGFTLHSELELYVKAGIPPARVLQIATRDAARVARADRDRGSIAVGKFADLVLVDGDPTTNIADIRKVALVVTQGNAISPSTAYGMLGIAPFVKDVPVVRTAPRSTAATPGRGGAGGASRAGMAGRGMHPH